MAVGAGSVVAACAVTKAVITYVIVPDDGLESLMALPIAAFLGGIGCLVGALRARPRQALVSALVIAVGGTTSWALLGLVLGIGDDLGGPIESAISLALLGGVMFGFGCFVGLGLGIAIRAIARAASVTRHPSLK